MSAPVTPPQPQAAFAAVLVRSWTGRRDRRRQRHQSGERDRTTGR